MPSSVMLTLRKARRVKAAKGAEVEGGPAPRLKIIATLPADVESHPSQIEGWGTRLLRYVRETICSIAFNFNAYSRE
jgi:hypothetical protein